MRSDKTTARVVGILFIVATAAAVCSNIILNPLRDDLDYLTEFAANENRVILGALSEVILAVAVIAIAVLLFPLLKPKHEGMALGYVGARTLEGAIIIVGAISSLLLLTLSQAVTSRASAVADAESTGAVLLDARDWTDSLGQMIVFSLSALILYGLLYQTRLVPRWLSVWGFAGGVLLMAAGVLTMYREDHLVDTDWEREDDRRRRGGPRGVVDRRRFQFDAGRVRPRDRHHRARGRIRAHPAHRGRAGRSMSGVRRVTAASEDALAS